MENNVVYKLDSHNNLYLPWFDTTILPGESTAILGARGTDIDQLLSAFKKNPARKSKPPIIRIVSTNTALFKKYSAYDNFSMAETSVIPYRKKQLHRLCEEIKRRFNIKIDFSTPLQELSVSEQIIIEVVHAYISKMDILICDNLLSQLVFEDRKILISIFRKMQEEGKSIIYLTTKWEYAVQISSRILIVSEMELLGEMKTSDVIKNPQPLLYLLSGKNLIEPKPEDTSSFLDMLYSSAEYMTNNYELNEALAIIINNVCQTINCQNCCIYLRQYSTAPVLQYIGDNINLPALKESFLHDNFHDFEFTANDIFYINKNDLNFNDIFAAKQDDIKSIMSMPVICKGKIIGGIYVFFTSASLYNHQDYLYLKSFCKEVAIVIETSKLISNSILLQESNHRIKNNLQLIISILTMQRLYLSQNPNADVNDIFDSITNTIFNIASLHDLLTSNISHSDSININQIINSILNLYEASSIKMHLQCNDFVVPYASVTSISMVINEVIANCSKHAFKGERSTQKQIHIICVKANDDVNIEIRDNGIGISPDIDINHTQSVGLSIIRTIVKNELHGSLQLINTGSGTLVRITFPYAALIK